MCSSEGGFKNANHSFETNPVETTETVLAKPPSITTWRGVHVAEWLLSDQLVAYLIV